MRIHEIDSEFIFEMPQKISDENFGLNSDKINHEMAMSILRDGQVVKVGEINGIGLYSLPDKYAMIYEDDDGIVKIGYYVKYKVTKIDVLGIKAVQQVAIWRGYGREFTNVASKIFFDYLLPKYGYMVTDSHQTDNGQLFWFDRVKDAFSLGYKIYHVDLSNGIVQEVKTFTDFKNLKGDVWGEDDDYQHKRIIIGK